MIQSLLASTYRDYCGCVQAEFIRGTFSECLFLCLSPIHSFISNNHVLIDSLPINRTWGLLYQLSALNLTLSTIVSL